MEDITVVLRAHELRVNICAGEDEERIANELWPGIKALKGEFPIDLAAGTSAARMRSMRHGARITVRGGRQSCAKQRFDVVDFLAQQV